MRTKQKQNQKRNCHNHAFLSVAWLEWQTCIPFPPIPGCAKVLGSYDVSRYHWPFKSQALKDSSGEAHHLSPCPSKPVLCCYAPKAGMHKCFCWDLHGRPCLSSPAGFKDTSSLIWFIHITIWWPIKGPLSMEGKLDMICLGVKTSLISFFCCSRKKNKSVNSY